ncbi:hypothetical protein KI688_003642 [Linnemannia hyalina]|uniref:Uncharacterized protein n=1 Tax=Linnemannia hyalina TaxID=64524 RepID=A0A9P8BSZ7_9FUNG|nr:hypothetical protein KI688_003642 [Linnemannia hyalina]
MSLNSIRNGLHVVIPVAAVEPQVSFSEHSEPASDDASTHGSRSPDSGEVANTPQSAEAGGSHPGPPGSDNGTGAEQTNMGLD